MGLAPYGEPKSTLILSTTSDKVKMMKFQLNMVLFLIIAAGER